MRELFEIGLNDGGCYVFPYTSPPQCQQAKGDEVGIEQATELCDSLNRDVEDYIAQASRDNPEELLQAIAKHRSWTKMLSLIEDLIWHKYLRTVEATPQGALYQNWLALTRLIVGWVE